MPLNHLPQADPLVDALRQELARERDSIELIASENFTSPAVMEAVGSVLTNKYAEGYPRKRYYGGCEKVDLVEDLARERACQLFGAGFANVQPHCGANANLGAYEALIELGDTVLGMSLDQGGHLTHGSPVNFSGRYYNFASYGVDPDSGIFYENIDLSDDKFTCLIACRTADLDNETYKRVAEVFCSEVTSKVVEEKFNGFFKLVWEEDTAEDAADTETEVTSESTEG